MPGFYERRRKRAWRKIKTRGMLATLSRGTPPQTQGCYVLEDTFSTRDIDGTVIMRGDRRFLCAALNVAGTEPLDPPTENHSLIVPNPDEEESATTELIMASPPGRLAPGTVVIYYELHCRER